jgi:hypothetical protein
MPLRFSSVGRALPTVFDFYFFGAYESVGMITSFMTLPGTALPL